MAVACLAILRFISTERSNRANSAQKTAASAEEVTEILKEMGSRVIIVARDSSATLFVSEQARDFLGSDPANDTLRGDELSESCCLLDQRVFTATKMIRKQNKTVKPQSTTRPTSTAAQPTSDSLSLRDVVKSPTKNENEIFRIAADDPEPSPRYCLIRTTPVTFLGQSCTAVVLDDASDFVELCTARKDVKAAEQTIEGFQKTQATVAHELRTPLGIAIMFVETLLLTASDGSDREQLTVVQSQLNILLSMVNDILDRELIEKGRFEPKLESFAPEQLFNEIT